jgi:hypothetical protein
LEGLIDGMNGKLIVSNSLSSPFMDGSSACGFFDIILGLFVEADIQGSGKIVGMSFPHLGSSLVDVDIVLDEAHKVRSLYHSGRHDGLTQS